MGRRAQRRAEVGTGDSRSERSDSYGSPDLDRLADILERTARAGIDPQRVIVALDIPAPIISAVRQRRGRGRLLG